jgi:hypothetical protein
MRGFLHMLFAIFAGVATGWLSAVGLIENYGYDAVASSPQWRERRSATDHPAAPYAFGYFINQGQVPPPLTARHFVRTTDDAAGNLRAECIYELSGKLPPARRWSMAVSDGENVVSTLGAGEAVYEIDGSIRVFLAAQPIPGNRLTMKSSSVPLLSFTIHDPRDADAQLALPSLKRVRC